MIFNGKKCRTIVGFTQSKDYITIPMMTMSQEETKATKKRMVEFAEELGKKIRTLGCVHVVNPVDRTQGLAIL